MKFRIIIDPEAHKDIQSAISYYESKKVGLGRDFHAILKKQLVRLQTFPFHVIRYKNVRMMMVGIYPYAIHYTVEESEKTISIWGVIHTSMDPDTKWPWVR
jgi:mRNA-degrading endonuclease RelE of RelBE toxin-antitoxin system